jgi:hypothetical protein
MRRHFTDSPPMRQTAASLPPFDALDQWGIEYPLRPEDFARLDRPASSRLAAVLSRWSIPVPKIRLARPVGLDQWGIEYPIPDAQLAAFVRHGLTERLRVATFGGRFHGAAQFGACAAIAALVIAVSAPAVFVHASAVATPTAGAPIVIVGADAVQLAPASTLDPTAIPAMPGPTAEAPLSALAVGADSVSSTASPVPHVRPLAAGLGALPTVEDAKEYLVTRLGNRVVKLYGMSQAACASQIFQNEANWDPHATNKSTGAYGLPQANPASKLGNWAESKATAAANAGDANSAWLYRAWRDNPVAQAEWGVNYMNKRYGSPCAALAFRNGYWQDGVLIPGVGWY